MRIRGTNKGQVCLFSGGGNSRHFFQGSVQPTFCSEYTSHTKDVEQVLSKWPQHVVSLLPSVHFVDENTGMAAAFDPLTSIVSIYTKPDIKRNIRAVDHEIGHLVFEVMSDYSLAATRPLLEEYDVLKDKHKDESKLWRSDEYRQLNERVGKAELYPEYTSDDWNRLQATLERHPETACIQAFLKLGYDEVPDLQDHLKSIVGYTKLAVWLRNLPSITDEDRGFLTSYVLKVKEMNNGLKDAVTNIQTILEDREKACTREQYETASTLLTSQENNIEMLLQDSQRIDAVKNSVAGLNEQQELEKLLLEMQVTTSSLHIIPLDSTDTELFARGVQGLMNLYFGPAKIGMFQLDEQLLQEFVQIKIDGQPVFLNAVEQYRQGLVLYEQGISVEEIQQRLPQQKNSTMMPEVLCFNTSEDELSYKLSIIKQLRSEKE